MTLPPFDSGKDSHPHTATTRTYAERYCERHGIPVEKFRDHLLVHSLHAPLRWLWPLCGWALKSAYEVDRQCIEAVGQMRHREAVYAELAEYGYNPANNTFWRRRMNQRLSTRRVLRALRNLPK